MLKTLNPLTTFNEEYLEAKGKHLTFAAKINELNINNAIMEKRELIKDSFDSRYGSSLGKALRSLDKRVQEYFSTKDEYGILHSPISSLLGLWYMGDCTAKAVVRKITGVLNEYDLLYDNPSTGKQEGFADKVLERRYLRVRETLSRLTLFNGNVLENPTKTRSFAV